MGERAELRKKFGGRAAERTEGREIWAGGKGVPPDVRPEIVLQLAPSQLQRDQPCPDAGDDAREDGDRTAIEGNRPQVDFEAEVLEVWQGLMQEEVDAGEREERTACSRPVDARQACEIDKLDELERDECRGKLGNRGWCECR